MQYGRHQSVQEGQKQPTRIRGSIFNSETCQSRSSSLEISQDCPVPKLSLEFSKNKTLTKTDLKLEPALDQNKDSLYQSFKDMSLQAHSIESEDYCQQDDVVNIDCTYIDINAS